MGREDPLPKGNPTIRTIAMQANFTFVALDDDGTPVPITAPGG